MLPRWLKQIHWPLFFSAAGLFALGTLYIYSASLHDAGHYEVKQIFWVSIGLVVMLAVPFLGYRPLMSMSYLFYLFSIFLLLLVLVAGSTRLGAQRWISLGPIAIQPSEFAKLATVMALANYLGSNYAWEREKRSILMALFLGLLPFMLIVRQPDLGSALIFLPATLIILFVWGLKYRYLIVTLLFGAVAAPLGWFFLKPYQKKRILVFLDPTKDPLGSGYTAIQSKIAIGSGGLFGKGYLQGTQSQLQFVPEHHTDFIFCVIGEEGGLLVALGMLVLYGLLFRSAFQVMTQTTDLRARLLIVGIVTMLFTQAFINIGMTFGLMPITGITLPLVSYGGSSIIATTFALGLVLSVYKERSIF